MEYHGVKIDFNGLAMVITAITGGIATIMGLLQRQKNRRKKGDSDDKASD